MSIFELLGFAVLIYALWAKDDVTLNGKMGFFSFFFQAKGRKHREEKSLRRRK